MQEACGEAYSPCHDDNREHAIPMMPAVRGSAGKASWMRRCQCMHVYVCMRKCLLVCGKGKGTV